MKQIKRSLAVTLAASLMLSMLATCATTGTTTTAGGPQLR